MKATITIGICWVFRINLNNERTGICSQVSGLRGSFASLSRLLRARSLRSLGCALPSFFRSARSSPLSKNFGQGGKSVSLRLVRPQLRSSLRSARSSPSLRSSSSRGSLARSSRSRPFSFVRLVPRLSLSKGLRACVCAAALASAASRS